TASATLSKTCACASTMSAPDAAGPAAGLGHPSRGATSRISVNPKLSIARAALPIFSPSCGLTRTMTGGRSPAAGAAASVCCDIAHRTGEFLEITRFGKVTVDRGEPDVGDGIQLTQSFHHHRADPGGRDLA